MRFFIFFTILTFTLLSGCGSNTSVNTSNSNSNSANAAKTNAANASNPLATNRAPEEATVNKAETIAPVVAAFCDAVRKKDDAALRKIYSQSALKSLEADMREEKQTSLAEYLSSEPVGDKCEVRNEKIEGERAIAEVRTETYPNGVKMYFVKEAGAWKMLNESPEIESVKQSANSATK